VLGGWIGKIGESLDKIDKALEPLKRGWVGDSATEAKAFFDEWTAAMVGLFGTKQRPQDGALVLVATALMASANNYNVAEDFMIKALGGFNQGITPTPSGGGSHTTYIAPPGVWTTEWWQGAVSEVF
jgi:hypothetical protein